MPYRETITGIIDRIQNAFQGNDAGNAPVLLMLGGFKFSLNTAVFTELRRSTAYQWKAQERITNWDALQYNGPGLDRITLPGIVYPAWKGGSAQMYQLRSLANEGRPLKLIASSGEILGAWVIETIEEGQSYFTPDGNFLRQEFTVSIRKYDDGTDL